MDVSLINFLSLGLPRVIRVHNRPTVTYSKKDENWKLFAPAQALTVTTSAWAKAREDSRTDSTKRPDGGNGGVGGAMTWTRLGVRNGIDFCPERPYNP